MGALIGMLVGKQLFGKVIGEKAARAIVMAGLFLLILGVLGTVVACIRHDAVSDHEAKIEHKAAKATDQAASERSADAIANARKEQEMHDAIHSVPDAAPAGPSHALACKRLHNLGRDPPACR